MSIDVFFLVKEDFCSACRKGFLYAEANERVKLISEHGSVCIVEKENGERFPIRADILVTQMNDPPIEKQSTPYEKIVVKSIPKKKKSSSSNQKNLF
jgi:hypothetical protein